ncbi:MAG: hypothetical protein QOF19_3062 [Alphaproteobacteria bacterium]|jgi:hypothetical protein|nr:hypothetical protein [Alphaproteobacteria bacterium]
MSLVYAWLEWLETTDLSLFLQQSPWAFPTIESTHVLAISLVIGTIAVLDLRLLGLASVKWPVADLAHFVLPYTWGAFLFAAMTGALMFTSQPTGYFANLDFRAKMLVLLAAAANMLVFHFLTGRDFRAWDREAAVPVAGKIAGALSLTCWIAIVFLGRQIGFTMGAQ